MEAFDVTVCVECRTSWPAGSDQQVCATADHTHRRMSLHRHRDLVELPGGGSVVGVSFDPDAPYARDRTPDYGLYLDQQWQPPWPHDHLDWPDFGVPADADADAVVAALDRLLRRARAGELVEVGCLGGHGRTGAALSGLAVRCGVPAREALAWVRDAYCRDAVETAEQESLVGQIDLHLSRRTG